VGSKLPGHTFLFADLAGFTALTDAMGDEDAANLAESFSDAVRELLPDHRAEAVKAIGDALMIRAEEASEAIRLGLRIVHEVGGQHFFPMVRVGMHTGPAVERNGDWFGATVNVAARVSGIAAGGEVLVTEATRQAAGDLAAEVDFHQRGRQALRNVEEPVSLYAAVRRATRPGSVLPIDPVCRMAVDPDNAAGAITHQGTQYYFCSLTCVGRFAARPDKFAATGSPKRELGTNR
jgi:adenylate cyclase